MPRFNRTMKSVRSGLRRYPRAIYESLRNAELAGETPDIPDILQQLCPHELAVMWLGHASVVSQIHDLSIVVDPVLSERIGMRLGKRTIGLRRLEPCPIKPSSLKGVDLILITHAHFDHLDLPTLRAIADTHTRVIVPRSCRRLIPPGFGRIIELYPDEKIEFDGLSIRAIEPEHWGARKVIDRHRGVNSYLIESDGRSVFFAGDTALTRAFEHLSEIDLAVFGIGAYEPWEHMHATPEQAWSMFSSLGARYLLPVHHSTFELSDEHVDEPTSRLRQIAGDVYAEKVLEPQLGELIVIEAPEQDSQPG